MNKAVRKRISAVLILSVMIGLFSDVTVFSRGSKAASAGPDRDWYLQSIGQPEAKSRIEKTGHKPGEGIVVAVLDTGTDITHTALKDHLWVNEAEKNGKKGIDDDKNGYVDDIYGINIYNSSVPVDDSHGHGTQISGIIAMEAEEITGVAPGAKIMPVKLDAGKEFSIDSAIEGIEYAVDNGADIINMSFATPQDVPRFKSALEKASKSCILISAAGNENDNTTDKPSYPSGYAFVTGVMSHGSDGKISDFSNWDIDPGTGAEYEIAAPGKSIYTTTKDGKYGIYDGTSHAAAVVSGSMAVCLSAMRFAGKRMELSQFGSWFINALKHTTVPDVLHHDITYPKLYIPDVLDAIAGIIPTASVEPAPSEEPEASPPPDPVETQTVLKKGAVVKAGSGKTKAKYKVKSAGKKTVIYYQSMVSKTAKTATIPAKIRLSDGKTYTVVSVKKTCFSKRKKLRRVIVFSKKITSKMMKKAIKGSHVKTVLYK